MGGTQSKSAVETLTESITDIAMKSVANCTVISDQEQDVAIIIDDVWDNNELNIKQATTVKVDCLLDAQRNLELQNEIIRKISQESTTSGIGVLSAFSADSAEAVTKVSNIVRTAISAENIANLYTRVKQTQNVTLIFTKGGKNNKINISQGADVYAACVVKSLDDAGLFNTIDEYIKSKADSELKNPLDFIKDIFGGISTAIIAVIGVIVFIIIALIVALIYGLSGGGGSREGGYSRKNIKVY